MEQKYYQQIDILKALAIISVVILHTIPEEYLYSTFAVFHIWQAVPVFMIIMGVNLAMSFKRREYHKLNEMYSLDYLLRRFERIVYPFILFFVLTFIFGIIKTIMIGENRIYLGALSLIGFLPVTGPGNYFITLLFQLLIYFL